jgi:hypothetical protein
VTTRGKLLVAHSSGYDLVEIPDLLTCTGPGTRVSVKVHSPRFVDSFYA